MCCKLSFMSCFFCLFPSLCNTKNIIKTLQDQLSLKMMHPNNLTTNLQHPWPAKKPERGQSDLSKGLQLEYEDNLLSKLTRFLLEKFVTVNKKFITYYSTKLEASTNRFEKLIVVNIRPKMQGVRIKLTWLKLKIKLIWYVHF